MSNNSEWILNPKTGRMIKKGGKTHKILLRHGVLESYVEPVKTIESDETNIEPVIENEPNNLDTTQNTETESESSSSFSFTTSESTENQEENCAKEEPKVETKPAKECEPEPESKPADKCIDFDLDPEKMSEGEVEEFYEYLRQWEEAHKNNTQYIDEETEE